MPAVVKIFEAGDYEHEIEQGASVLRDGGIVVLPTETVYGAAASITIDNARKRLRAFRREPASTGKPFIVHVPEPDSALRYLDEPSDLAQRMMRKLWPGPVALVFDVSDAKQRAVSTELNLPATDLYDSGSITLRCPNHPVATDVLSQVAGPVALTLAGASSGSSGAPINWEQLDGKADLIFDAGPTRYSKPSTIVRVRGQKWEILREGIYDQRIIERLLRTTILFVCSGNTCRSPMAEALARKILADSLHVRADELEIKGMNVLSAGSFAMPGARATPEAVEAMTRLGADLSRHRSRPLSVELIHQADLILTMSRSHAQGVVALVPAAAEKTSPLDPEGDIEDPIGGDQSLYLELAQKLQGLIETRLREKHLI